MTNVCFAALDTAVVAGRAEQPVLLGPPMTTFAVLLEESAALGGVLRGFGVVPGTTVLCDLADDRDAVVARLACARVGALAVSTPDDSPASLATVLDALTPEVALTSRPEVLRAHGSRGGHTAAVTVVRGGGELVDPTRDVDWDLMLRAGRTDPAPMVDLLPEAPCAVAWKSDGAGLSTVLRPVGERAALVAGLLVDAPVTAAALRAVLEG